MANEGSTIILANLNTEELEKSIKKVVDAVEKGSKEMAEKFDTSINAMIESMKKLSSLSNDVSTHTEKSTSSRAKESKAVNETVASYDNLAKAKQKAIEPQNSSARDSYEAMLKGMRESAVWLAKELKNVDNVSLDKQLAEYNKFEAKIEEAKRKVVELKEQLRSGEGGRLVQSQTMNEIARYEQMIKDLTAQQIAATKKIEEEYKQYGTLVKQEYDAMVKKIQEVFIVKQQESKFTEKQISEAKQYTEEIKKQAQAIRESNEMKSSGSYTMKGTSGYQYTISADSDRLSIEQQLVEMHKYENELAKEYGVITKQNTQATIENAGVEERRIALIKSGENAYNSLSKMTNSNGQVAISFTQLKNAIYDMHNAYAVMTDAEKQSSFGVALKQRLDAAKKAMEEFGSTTKKTKEIVLNLDASEKSLSNRLSELRNAYKILNREERESANGRQLLSKIHELENAIRQLRQEIARPLNFKSIETLPQNTIDNIAYKIQQLTKYRGGLDFNTQGEEIRKVNDLIAKLQRTQREAIGTNARYAESNNALTRSFNYMKNRMAFYLTVGATTQFVKQLADIRGQYEMTERSLQILTDSAEKGTAIFNQLSTMALNSPFTAMQLTDAARQLSALGFEANELVGTVKRLGDISAAVGAPIDRISYALGQVQTYGYLTSLQARTFMRMGIPLVKALSEEYSKLEGHVVTTGDVFQRMKDKAISYNDVMRVVNRMTDEGGRFFDYQAKVSETLRVQLSNLSLAWQNMLNNIGKSNQSLLAAPIKAMRALFANWEAISRVIRSAVIGFGVTKLLALMVRLKLGAAGTKSAFEATFGSKMVAKVTTLGSALKGLFTSMTFWTTLVLTGIFDFINHFGQVEEHIKQINESIKEGAAETSKNIEDYLKNSNEIENSLYRDVEVKDQQSGKTTTQRVNVDISMKDAQPAWEELRNEIENSSQNADVFITQLMQIDNISERLRKGFDVARLIQNANSALKEMKDDAIDVNQDTWLWGLFGEGMKSDLKDYKEELKDVEDVWGSIDSLMKQGEDRLNGNAISAIRDLKNAQKEFADEVATTSASIEKFLDGHTLDLSVGVGVFDADKFAEQWVVAQEQVDVITKKVAEQEELTAQETYEFRKELNTQLYAHYHQLLLRQVDESKGADKSVALERVRIFEDTWEANRVSLDRFLNWMKNENSSAVLDMYNQFTDNGRQAFKLTSDEGKAKIDELLEKFKQNNFFAYEDLKDKVKLANLLEVFIPVIFGVKSDPSAWITEGFKEHMEKASKELKDAQDELVSVNAALQSKSINKNEQDKLEKRRDDLNATIKRLKEEKDRFNYTSDSESKQQVKDAKAAETARKKALKEQEKAENKARRAREKAQREAEQEQRRREQELAKALRDEVSLVEKLRASYDKLRKEGVAPETITSTLLNNYDATFKDIDKIVKQYGLKGFDFFDFVNPFTNTFAHDNTIFTFFEEQLDVVKNSSFKTRDALKSLEELLAKMREESWTKTMEDITKVMGENIDSLSTNYELSLDVEENPELSELFSNMMGIDVSELLKDAPKSLKEFTDEVNTIVGGAMNAYLVNIGNKDTFENFMSIRSGEEFNILDETQFKRLREILTEDSQLFKDIEKLRDDLIKKNRKFFDDAQKTFDDYLSKYGKYSDKVLEIEEKRIQDMQTLDNAYYSDELKKTEDYARKKQAIERMTQKELQKLSFEEFKDSEWYITMFGDLDNMSMTTLDVLIGKLQEMKDTMKELDPQNLKTIQTEIDKIMTIRAKKSPIKNFVKDIKEYNRLAKQRKQLEKDLVVSQQSVDNQKIVVELAAKQVEEAKKKYGVNSEEYQMAQNNLKVQQDILDTQKKDNESLVKKLKRYGSLKKLLEEEAGAVQEFLDSINKYAQLFGDFLESIGDNTGLEDTTRKLSDLVGVAQSAVEGFKTGGVWGAVIAGALSLGTTIAKWLSGDGSIDKALQRSELRVKQLERAYNNLEESVNDAYGTMVVGLQKAQIENKKLQLVEMERQLRLEQGRKKKNQDKGKIEDLKSQINDLKNELANSTETIVNEMLGISGVAGFAEDLVSSMISAFKEGEDYMDVFNDKWDDMIDHMIMKLVVGKVIGDYFNDLFKQMEGIVEERTRKEANEYTNLVAARDAGAATMSNGKLREFLIMQRMQNLGYTNSWDWFEQDQRGYSAFVKSLSDDYLNNYRKALNENIAIAERNLKEASDVATYESYELLLNSREGAEERVKMLKDILAQYGIKFGEGTNKELSQLQQGIQGITEDTASALEAYMNGVSQQVYLQSDLLTQIRDIMVGYDFTLQSATNAEILLSLQQSYQVQMAIQSILVGWSNASGQAVRVEMIA